MRFRSFHLEGFGIYRDVTVAGLPRLGVFTGANESGKTTLLEFLRFMLFGDRPGSAGAAVYPPLRGGRRGGRLAIETAAGQRLDLERFGAGRTARPVILDAAGAAVAEPEEVLAALLGGLDRGAYERIFALGAADLAGLGLLDDRTLVRRLAAAAAGTPALPGALARLDREIGALLKGDRARTPRVNAAFLALDDALARHRSLAGEGDRFARARALLDVRQGEAGDHAAEIERERQDLERASRAQPLFGRVDRLADCLADPTFQTPSAPRGAILGFLGAGIAGALALAATGRLGLAVGVLTASASAALVRTWLHRQGLQRLAERRAPIESEIAAARQDLLAATGSTDPDAYAESLAARRARLRALEERERALQREIGALAREVEELGRDAEIEVALADAAATRADLDFQLGEWARRVLCRDLLERARARHEAERRPRVVAAAERYLSMLLATAPQAPERMGLVGEESLLLRDGRGALRSEGQWSSGLADQVYLAVRLGFAEELARGGPGPPLVLDDVHLRFDPARRRGLARALRAFSSTRQVLVFSNQPELAADFTAERASEDDVGFFAIADGRIDRVG